MPHIDVIRPADPEETAGAFVAAMQRTDGPTLLALTRQVVPILNDVDVKLRREGVLRGGYVAKKEKGKLDLIILSCGSELQHALAAAKEIGEGVRVVSMPCFERFESPIGKISRGSSAEIMSQTRRHRSWHYPRFGTNTLASMAKSLGCIEFGLSAPGAEVMKERGIDAKHVVEAARSL